MSVKRLAAPLFAIIALLAVAGVLEIALLLFPGDSEAVADVGMMEAPVAKVSEVKWIARRVERAVEVPERAGYVSEVTKRARALVESGGVVVDGAPLGQKLAERIVNAAGTVYDPVAAGARAVGATSPEGHAPFTSNVIFINQKDVLRSGCELVSLAVALHAEGIEASPVEIAEKYLRMGEDPANDYLSTPDKDGGGLPPCIVDAANGWLADHGGPADAYNLTGTSLDSLMELVRLGYPVLTWTTEKQRDPTFVKDTPWYQPEHCVVLYGAEGDGLLVSDSLEGLVVRDRATFARIYEACGNRAVIVVPAA